MYYRKQVKEERKRLKEAVRQQKLEDQLPEHEKAALAELQHFDEKLNASVKQERKAMQSIVRKPKFK
jgi:predicted restriction endonuclease